MGANVVAAVNWNDAQRRVAKSYREWIRSVCHPRYTLERYGCEYCGLSGLAGLIGLDWDGDGEGGENWMSH